MRTLGRAARLKAILNRRDSTLLPGAPNALFGLLIQQCGFEAIYVTGAGIANMSYGVPDIGLVTLTEIASHVSAICDVVSIPVLVDADTGFGNAINVVRTIKVLERAGAAGIQIEDQVFPKRCGHFSGKAVISSAEMVQKIKAAADARVDGDLQIVARTDAYAVQGISAALDRAHAYIDAGADATFVEAPSQVDQLRRIASELSAPQIANIVHGGLTPEIGRQDLADMGFAGVLYANAALQAAMKAVQEVLGSLNARGSLEGVHEMLATFEERQRAVAKQRFDDLEQKYKHSSPTEGV